MEITEDSVESGEVLVEKKTKKGQNPFTFDRKEAEEKRRRRRGRVIVRNISFKATEEKLRTHFAQFGEITDLNLLKKPDGKLVGCAFVQFDKVTDAAKAILNASKKPFLGRPVYVDWAVGKDEYLKRKEGNVKDENGQVEVKSEDTEVKEEPTEVNESKEEVEVKSESDDEDSDENNSESEQESDDDEEDIEVKSEEGDSDEAMEEGEEDDDDKKKPKIPKTEEKPAKRTTNDINEGCTVFIKNVPFDATSDDLRKCCRKFGPVYYALINTDPVSGHSKGSGFVKFKTKDSADLCMASGEEFALMDTIMEALPALSREDVRNQNNAAKQKDVKDSRNLYLVKEGLIMTGSKSAEGVSAPDMNKRHKLEQTKAQILKNLNRFVSRNRLSIHNLPLHYDDEKLRNMVIKFTGFKPHESRVMRENKTSPAHPQGQPKGFGFISFKTHQDAISALRKLNNNPNVFSAAARPIVGFSIEDRSVHKIKQRRDQKARESNPNYQPRLEKLKAKKLQKKAAKKQIVDDKTKIQKDVKKQPSTKKAKPSAGQEEIDEANMEKFVGMAAKPGAMMRMRSNRKIREQADEHKKRLGEQKRKQKQRKEKLLHRIERKQIDRPKQGGKKTVDKDHFTNLVSKYKQMLDKTDEAVKRGVGGKRSKWYVD